MNLKTAKQHEGRRDDKAAADSQQTREESRRKTGERKRRRGCGGEARLVASSRCPATLVSRDQAQRHCDNNSGEQGKQPFLWKQPSRPGSHWRARQARHSYDPGCSKFNFPLPERLHASQSRQSADGDHGNTNGFMRRKADSIDQQGNRKGRAAAAGQAKAEAKYNPEKDRWHKWRTIGSAEEAALKCKRAGPILYPRCISRSTPNTFNTVRSVQQTKPPAA